VLPRAPLLALLAVAALAAPAEARAELVVAPSLAGGVEAGRHDATGLGELELALGWELPVVRPELGLVVGLAPDTYAALRPGLRASLLGGPLYVRGALDWAHAGGDWRFRWLLAGAGVEARLTSVLGGFVEADAGFPLGDDDGVGLLVRAGLAFRFDLR
jgi:hypothetical protein